LIRGAKATLFPSLYEGFGLPVVESMLLGTPVLTANTSCLPEIAGDAALSVDPYDIRQISAAIRALDTNAELRASLVEKGTKQARKFEPSVVDAKLATVYEKVSRTPTRREQIRRVASEIPFDASAIADWFRL
jgi:glycosyltransferase involved in cell wall biosynthesis